MDTDNGAHAPGHKDDDIMMQKRRPLDRPFKDRRFSKKVTLTDANAQLLDFYAGLNDCANEQTPDPSLPCIKFQPNPGTVVVRLNTLIDAWTRIGCRRCRWRWKWQ